jgi:hypothetical protein
MPSEAKKMTLSVSGELAAGARAPEKPVLGTSKAARITTEKSRSRNPRRWVKLGFCLNPSMTILLSLEENGLACGHSRGQCATSTNNSLFCPRSPPSLDTGRIPGMDRRATAKGGVAGWVWQVDNSDTILVIWRARVNTENQDAPVML